VKCFNLYGKLWCRLNVICELYVICGLHKNLSFMLQQKINIKKIICTDGTT